MFSQLSKDLKPRYDIRIVEGVINFLINFHTVLTNQTTAFIISAIKSMNPSNTVCAQQSLVLYVFVCVSAAVFLPIPIFRVWVRIMRLMLWRMKERQRHVQRLRGRWWWWGGGVRMRVSSHRMHNGASNETGMSIDPVSSAWNTKPYCV